MQIVYSHNPYIGVKWNSLIIIKHVTTKVFGKYIFNLVCFLSGKQESNNF